MIFLGKWLARIQFVCMFLLLTYFVYGMISTAAHWLEEAERQKFVEPVGPTVNMVPEEPNIGEGSVKERLLFFYRHGE